MVKLPEAGDGEFARVAAPVPEGLVVVDLDDEVSLDDLLEMADETDAGGDLPEWAAEFAAALDVDDDPFSHGVDPVWADEGAAAAAVGVPSSDAVAPEPVSAVPDGQVAVFLDVDGVLSPAPDVWGDVTVVEAGPRGSVAVSPAMLSALGRLPGQLVWATAWAGDAGAVFAPMLGRDGQVVGDGDGSVHGWWKLDAVVQWLTEHPQVRTVVWLDDELAAMDDLDLEHRETAWDVLADAGVECLLMAPADGLTPQELDEVRSFLGTPSTLTESLPEVDDSQPFVPAETNVEDASSGVAKAPLPTPARPPLQGAARLTAPIPDEW